MSILSWRCYHKRFPLNYLCVSKRWLKRMDKKYWHKPKHKNPFAGLIVTKSPICLGCPSAMKNYWEYMKEREAEERINIPIGTIIHDPDGLLKKSLGERHE